MSPARTPAPACAAAPTRAEAHRSCAAHNPIRNGDDAMDVISLALHQPLRPETVVLLLDDAGYGGTITVVSGTHRADDVLNVVECLAEVACASVTVAALVVASVRPSGGITSADIDRWLEASSLAESYGVQLTEWFVISPATVECPRELLGEPERW
jgi:hypothetical protein